MKIKISAEATDTQSGLKQINHKVSPTTITPSSGTLASGQEIELTATEMKEYTITFTAIDNVGNTSAGITQKATASDAMSVKTAKKLVTSMSALKQYIGQKVNYKPGETWQIFYYDQAGKFGPKNTLYLKKAPEDDGETSFILSTKTDDTDPAVQMMRRMNPKWAKSSHSAIDLNREKNCVWLCDSEIWDSRRNTQYSNFAIGSPSVEMYIKAFNVWKTGNKDSNYLECKIEDVQSVGQGQGGYVLGSKGNYNSDGGRQTPSGSLEAGPNNIFTGSTGSYWTLCSPNIDRS